MMTRTTLALLAGVHSGGGRAAPVVALALQSGGYGPWSTIISILRGLLITAGGLGFVVGIAIKGSAGGNANRQELGNRIIEGALAGLVMGLLGESIYNHIVGWTS